MMSAWWISHWPFRTALTQPTSPSSVGCVTVTTLQLSQSAQRFQAVHGKQGDGMKYNAMVKWVVTAENTEASLRVLLLYITLNSDV